MTRSLVTGGAGFVGSHLADLLLADGDEVLVIDDCSTGRRENVPAGARFVLGDIAERESFDAAVDAFAPDRIFHIAAQSSVTVSTTRPERDATVNVLGTVHVAEAARRHVCPVAFTSTGGALYGDSAPLPTSEEHPPAPLSPYGASKQAGEAYLRTWSRAHLFPVAICRLGNVYGPRQRPDGEAGVVAIVADHYRRGQTPLMFGEGRPVRDYVHVADVVTALRAACGHNGVYNIATGVSTSTRRIFELVAEAAGVPMSAREMPLRAGELMVSCMDPSRAAAELGWRAMVPVEQGVPETYRALAADSSVLSAASA